MQDNIDFDKYDEPRLHMERLMKAHLIEFDISLRILIPLENAGIRTLGDLIKRKESDLQNIRMLGAVAIAFIEKFVSYHGLALAK